MAQYPRYTNGQLNRPISIDFTIKLLLQHLLEDVSGLVNVVQITEMIGHLIKYFSIWSVAMEVASSSMLILLTLFLLNLKNGLRKLALSIQVSLQPSIIGRLH